MPFETRYVLFDRPIIRLEQVDMGAEFQMVADLVCEGFPRLGAPVEISAPAREGQKGSVKQHHARLQIGAVAGPRERNALPHREDPAMDWIRHGLRADLDIDDAGFELIGNLLLQATDERAKVFEGQPASFCCR